MTETLSEMWTWADVVEAATSWTATRILDPGGPRQYLVCVRRLANAQVCDVREAPSAEAAIQQGRDELAAFEAMINQIFPDSP